LAVGGSDPVREAARRIAHGMTPGLAGIVALLDRMKL